MENEEQRHLRCRIGLHRWARFKEEDDSLADPEAAAAWVWRCRYCRVERDFHTKRLLGVAGALVIGSIPVWLLGAPLLGAAFLVIAAMCASRGVGSWPRGGVGRGTRR